METALVSVHSWTQQWTEERPLAVLHLLLEGKKALLLVTCSVCARAPQMEYERQVASVRAQNALEGDFSISQAELSSRQAMLENASDIKVASSSVSPFIYLRFHLRQNKSATSI